jgi:hypothetical protein
MLLLATSMLGLSPMSIKRHAIELRDKGFTVVDASEAALGQALVADAQTACSSEFSRLLDGVEKLGIDPDEELFAFSEITTRHRGRYGFQPQTPSAWTRYVEAAVGSVATPVIEALHELPPHPEDMPEQAPYLTAWARHLTPSRPVIEHIDCIVSRPGAKAQGFHPDAGDTHVRGGPGSISGDRSSPAHPSPCLRCLLTHIVAGSMSSSQMKLARLNARHRLYNVFCPLKTLEEGGDGTMFWPGSHHRWGPETFAEAIARSGRLEEDAAVMAEMEVPACQAGGMASRPKHAPEACARSMRPKHAPEACTHDNPMPTRIQESRLGVALCGPALTLVLAAALDDFRRCHPVRLSVAPSWHAQRRWRASSGTRGAIHRPCQGPSRVSERQRSGARRCPP